MDRKPSDLTGGTDGEEMLKASFKALQKDSFSMADILIISDFIFPIPKKATAAKIQEEKLRGTRFYGLHIGSGNSGPGGIRQDYGQILEDIRMTFKDLPFLLFRQHGLQPSRHTAMAARTD